MDINKMYYISLAPEASAVIKINMKYVAMFTSPNYFIIFKLQAFRVLEIFFCCQSFVLTTI